MHLQLPGAVGLRVCSTIGKIARATARKSWKNGMPPGETWINHCLDDLSDTRMSPDAYATSRNGHFADFLEIAKDCSVMSIKTIGKGGLGHVGERDLAKSLIGWF